MIHIKVRMKHQQKDGSRYKAKCNATLGGDDQLTDAALASDCNDCRTLALVASTSDKTWDGKKIGVRPEPDFESKPMSDAEKIIREAIRNRDGQ